MRAHQVEIAVCEYLTHDRSVPKHDAAAKKCVTFVRVAEMRDYYRLAAICSVGTAVEFCWAAGEAVLIPYLGRKGVSEAVQSLVYVWFSQSLCTCVASAEDPQLREAV